MDVPANPDADKAPPAPESAPPRSLVAADGITVRKEATNYTDDAVAVEFVLRSERDGPAVVRVTDRLPEGVRDHPVEFHPNFDPSNWSREDDRCSYQAVVEPGSSRRTVYGVTVDDPEAVQWFGAEPTVEVIYHGASGVRDGDEGSGRDSDGDSTADRSAGSTSSTDAAAAGFAFGGSDDRRDAADGSSAAPTSERRHRTDAARGEGTIADASPPADRSVDLAGTEAAPTDLVERVAALEVEVEALHRRLEREIAWRVRLQQSLAADVGEPGSTGDRGRPEDD